MRIKLLSKNAKVPTRGSSEAAGYDLYTPKDITIVPGRNIVPLDIAIALPGGMEGHIRPRSGFSAKGFEGYELPRKLDGTDQPERFDADVIQGTIDSDYRNNVGVIVKSNEPKPFLVTAGTRIAQLVVELHYCGDIQVVEDLDETVRGLGGFGSTGTH